MKKLTIVATAALLALALSGCTGDSGFPFDSAAPVPVEIVGPRTAVAGDEFNETLELTTTQRLYELDDGTGIVLDREAMLPQAIIDDVLAQTLPRAELGSEDARWAQVAVLERLIDDAQVVNIVRGFALTREDAMKLEAKAQVTYIAMAKGEWLKNSGTYSDAETTALAEAYVAEQGGTEAGWMILKHY